MSTWTRYVRGMRIQSNNTAAYTPLARCLPGYRALPLFLSLLQTSHFAIASDPYEVENHQQGEMRLRAVYLHSDPKQSCATIETPQKGDAYYCLENTITEGWSIVAIDEHGVSLAKEGDTRRLFFAHAGRFQQHSRSTGNATRPAHPVTPAVESPRNKVWSQEDTRIFAEKAALYFARSKSDSGE